MFEIQVADPVKPSNVKAWRESLDISQEKVARLLRAKGIDISTTAYQRVERGETRTHWGDPIFVQALAEILGLSRKELLAMTGHLPSGQTGTGSPWQRAHEIIDELGPDSIDTAEAVLRALVKQQSSKDK